MSDEHDSWFNDTFGFDLGGAAKRISEEAQAARAQVASVVQTVQKKVDGVIDDVVNTATGVVKKVAEVAGGGGAGGGGLRAGGPGAPAGGGTGKFPLSGSVGRNGQNAPNDVKAVQRALGISDDGQCGNGTITAIENFQRSIGQSRPDGRVDAGGATERALAGGAPAASGPETPSNADDSGGLLGKVVDSVTDFAGGLARNLPGDPLGSLLGTASDLGGQLLQGAQGLPIDPASALNDFSLGGDLRLSLDHLSREQIAEAQKFLASHGFAAIAVRQGGQAFEDYDPFFDGKSSSLDDVFHALNGAIEPRPLQNPAGELLALVKQRFNELIVQEMKQADERARRAVQGGVKVNPDVSREDATKDLTTFLEKVLKAQGGKDLRVTEPVRVAGAALSQGLSGSAVAIASLLAGRSAPGRPAELAGAMTKCLPPTIPRENVEALDRIPVKETGAQPQSLVEVLGNALAKEVEGLIKLLPPIAQDTIRDAVKDSIEKGIMTAVEQAMSESKLDGDAQNRIKKIVEAAIKQKVK